MESANIGLPTKRKFYQKKWLRIILIILVVFLVAGGFLLWKTGWTLNKISGGGILSSIIHAVPGVEEKLKGENEDRINIMLLGMRGENIPGGGLLADTIMVVSIKPSENKASIISIPRDLYVSNPGWGNQTKINAVYAAGEENGKKQGISDMKKVVSDVLGMPIHYGVVTNFKGFVDLINALGGIDINLDQPFYESIQFREQHVCDGNVFTIPSGEYEIKKKKDTGRITAKYPLCYPDPKYQECGGNFQLPAGNNHLDGQKALCYVRSRVTSSDFERAKRQQIVLQAIKEKAFSVGTLTDFAKINNTLQALGDNAKTDMEVWEMQRLFGIYQKMSDIQLFQRVLENSEEGLLYSPGLDETAGYILLPRAGDYSQIHLMFENIFSLPPQSDIKPK
jgi:LCP family protein required for cell wall assembly